MSSLTDEPLNFICDAMLGGMAKWLRMYGYRAYWMVGLDDGELVPVPKDSHRASIPPKTFAWLDTYFRCARCNKLFWQGTHWHRMDKAMQGLPRESIATIVNTNRY